MARTPSLRRRRGRSACGRGAAPQHNPGHTRLRRPPALILGAEAPRQLGALPCAGGDRAPLPLRRPSDNRRSLIGVDAFADTIAVPCGGNLEPTNRRNYCIAGRSPPVSLPTMITELRAGMGMAPRLLAFPSGLFERDPRCSGATAAGRRAVRRPGRRRQRFAAGLQHR